MAALKTVRVIALIILGEVLTFPAGLDTQGCPPGWDKHGSSCYHIDRNGKTWAEADSFCRGLDSLLVVVKSTEEQAFITKTFAVSVWLGCKEEVEGDWVCVADGDTTKPMEFIDWYPGQPDNTGSLGCIESSRVNGVWYDGFCTNNYYPLCKRRVIATNKNICPQFCNSHKSCTQN